MVRFFELIVQCLSSFSWSQKKIHVKTILLAKLQDHFAKTALVCIENSHNMHGGATIEKEYIDSLGNLADELGIGVHIDGARIFNAAVSLGTPVAELCEGADSVSICCSKGLGAPMGSMLVGNKEFIRLAKRARKRLGGGTRQVGVIASMNMYALENNVERLQNDHERAKRIAQALKARGFRQPQDGDVQVCYDISISLLLLPFISIS